MSDRPLPTPPSPDAPSPPAVSARAVTALVLALLAAVVALVGVWWAEVLPLVLALWAVATVPVARRRGRGLAIAAAVVALVAGLYSFLAHRQLERAIEDHLCGLLGALDRREPERVARYARPEEEAAALAARWGERWAAATARLGRWQGAVRVGNVFLGAAASIVPPEGVTEVTAGGDRSPARGEAVWARARFERGEGWVAFVGGDPARPGSVLEDAASPVVSGGDRDATRAPARWVRDLRVFVAP